MKSVYIILSTNTTSNCSISYIESVYGYLGDAREALKKLNSKLLEKKEYKVNLTWYRDCSTIGECYGYKENQVIKYVLIEKEVL